MSARKVLDQILEEAGMTGDGEIDVFELLQRLWGNLPRPEQIALWRANSKELNTSPSPFEGGQFTIMG